jgi:hypothetical protein
VNRTLAALACLAGGAASFAQFPDLGSGWSFECIDPENTSPFSGDWLPTELHNDLIGVALGLSGTVTYGGQNGPCYGPTAATFDAAGRMAFFSGPIGSLQSNFDDRLALSMGAPLAPAGDFTYTVFTTGDPGETNDEDLDEELFGDGGLRVFYESASKRQHVTVWDGAEITVRRETRVVGDAVRFRYSATNTSTEEIRIGMRFGLSPWMRTDGNITDPETGANQAFTLIGSASGNAKYTADRYIGILETDTRRPARTGFKYRSGDANFPSYIRALFGQAVPYGLRLENGPTEATSDASSVNMVKYGNHTSTLEGNAMNLNLFGDITGVSGEDDVIVVEGSIIQQFNSNVLASGATQEFIHYVRSSWGTSDYLDPYSVVLDAPQFIAGRSAGLNGVAPNPFPVALYIDNQYADIDREVTLTDVVAQLILPDGLSLASGSEEFQRLDTIAPNAIRSFLWQVESDGSTIGDLPITVSIRSGVGPAKTISGVVRVSGTPTMRLASGPNMVTFPYFFTDTSLNEILQLQSGVDYLAYRWDPVAQSYQAVNTPERGLGYWVVPNSDQGIVALQGASDNIPDRGTGGLLTTMRRGWNLIGNPYNVPVKLSELNLVVEETPSTPLTWNEAVANDRVEPGIAFYNGSGYSFLENSSSLLLPGQGYWVQSNSYQPIRISWPPVFTAGVTGTGRSVERAWPQTDRAWRLQIAGRAGDEHDSWNYIGYAADRGQAKLGQMGEPPMAPSSSLRVAIAGEESGLSSAVVNRSTDLEWTLQVTSLDGENVTLTWPNLGQVPRGLRFRMEDAATGQSINLRSASSYTVAFTEPGTREIKVSADSSGSSRPVIGSAIVAGDSRSAGGSVSLNYSISTDALVTVRVLSGSGKEVYTISRGRSVSAGENTAVWTLRDNANRAVAPGSYRFEITAETTSGERVRRIVPVNVVR